MVRGQLHGMHSGGGSHFRKYDELDDKVDKYTKLGSKEVHNNLIKIYVKNNFDSLSYYFTRDEALFCGLFFITDTLHIPTILDEALFCGLFFITDTFHIPTILDEALFCGLFFITDTLHIPTIFTHLWLLPIVCRTSSTIILE